MFCAGIVGVIQFWNPFKFRMFRTVALFVQLRLGFEFHPTLNAFDDPTLACLQERILVECWVIFQGFFSRLPAFFQYWFFKKFQEHYQCVKQFGSSSGPLFLVPTVCKLFAWKNHVLVNNLSVMSERVFLGWSSTKQGLMCVAQKSAKSWSGPQVRVHDWK